MKFLLALLALVAVVFAGCKTTSYTRTEPNGEKVTLRDTRFFLNTSATVKFQQDTNGTKTLAVEAKSDVNADAIKAAAEGVAAGLVKGGAAVVKP